MHRRFRSALAALAVIGLCATSAAPAAASPDESVRPARVQVRITTGDVSGAGTDDPVFVSFSPTHSAWLDAPGDDWERGAARTYDVTLDGTVTKVDGEDVQLPGITRIADITRLQVGKHEPVAAGPTTIFTDDWCVQSVQVMFNGKTVFSAVAPRLAPTDTCRWLRGGTPRFAWSGTQLRSNKYWVNTTDLPMLLLFTNAHLVERVISGTAAKLHENSDLRWGDKELAWVDGVATWVPEVTVRRVDDRTVHVRVDLAARVPGVDSEVDLDFDLRFGCVNPPPDPRTGVVRPSYYTVTTEHVRVNVDSWTVYDLLFAGIALDIHIWSEINAGLNMAGTTTTSSDGRCVVPAVRWNGDLSFLGF